MAYDLVFASIRQGDLTAAEAWKLLSPLVKTGDPRLASGLFDALRAWTWKALDRRRRDTGLREWVDVMNRIEGFLADRFREIAAKIEVLAELLHESLAVAELASPEDLLRRKHIGPLLKALASREGEWVERAVIMDELGLKPANTTRLMSLLADIGWAEQLTSGREAAYRISAEGMVQARGIAPQPVAMSELPTREAEWKILRQVRAVMRGSGKNLFIRSEPVGTVGDSNPRPWEQEVAEMGGFIEAEWDDEDTDVTLKIDAPPAARVLASAGACW